MNSLASQLANRMEQAPIAQSTIVQTKPANMKSVPGKSGTFRVSHREYIQDVVGQPAFTCVVLNINPGRNDTFPWLSAIGQRFESYRFLSLAFEYKPSCSTSTAGKVILAIDFDAEDSPPNTKQEALSYKGAVSAAPWQEAKCVIQQIDNKKLSGEKYTRDIQSSYTDLKTYDLGTLNIVTQGMATTSTVGELYVSYVVELITPQTQVEQTSAKINSTSSQKGGWFPASAAVLGTDLASVTDVLAAFPNNDLLIKEPGQYLLNMDVLGSGLIGANLGLPTVVRGLAQATSEGWNLNSGATQWDGIISLNILQPNTILRFVDSSFATSISSVLLRLSEYVYSYS